LQFEIGRNSSSRYAHGEFDDVKIYDRALTLDQVQRLAGLTVTGELVAHYKLDGNADDSSGNNNHCTVNGIT
jgi:hypothetical protein